MLIVVNSGLSLRDKAALINPLIASKQVLKIKSIGTSDVWYHYQELIGMTGTFIPDETYGSLFQTETPVKITIGMSEKAFDKFSFVDAEFETV